MSICGLFFLVPSCNVYAGFHLPGTLKLLNYVLLYTHIYVNKSIYLYIYLSIYIDIYLLDMQVLYIVHPTQYFKSFYPVYFANQIDQMGKIINSNIF